MTRVIHQIAPLFVDGRMLQLFVVSVVAVVVAALLWMGRRCGSRVYSRSSLVSVDQADSSAMRQEGVMQPAVHPMQQSVEVDVPLPHHVYHWRSDPIRLSEKAKYRRQD